MYLGTWIAFIEYLCLFLNYLLLACWLEVKSRFCVTHKNRGCCYLGQEFGSLSRNLLTTTGEKISHLINIAVWIGLMLWGLNQSSQLTIPHCHFHFFSWSTRSQRFFCGFLDTSECICFLDTPSHAAVHLPSLSWLMPLVSVGGLCILDLSMRVLWWFRNNPVLTHLKHLHM